MRKLRLLTDLENDSSALGPVAGITGTPVIDPTSETLYLVALTENSSTGAIVQRLHAIDITTGQERLGSPVVISASVFGYWLRQFERYDLLRSQSLKNSERRYCF